MQRRDKLQAFADLHQDFLEGVLERRIGEADKRLQSVKTDLEAATDAVSAFQALQSRKEEELSDLNDIENQLRRLRPSLLDALFRRSSKREYDERTRENVDAQLAVRQEIVRLKQRLFTELLPKQQTAQDEHDKLDRQCASLKSELEIRENRLTSFRLTFPDAVLPEKLADIESANFQRQGLWHDEPFNRLRSDLFKAAMRLHEAWLSAVAVKSSSVQHYQTMLAISALLDGKQPGDEEHYQTLWQNFFMIVPVVSTTFASFSRQFRGLDEGALGWVFIDEAGQAVPQAAVGAMLRAKRALVIGDPLQIEPVFTLAQPLIKAFCDLSEHTRDGFYSPGKTSVQILADRANVYGEMLESSGRDLWTGSPLRVHRRCLDPMFSIANTIAYGDKMVHGSTNLAPGEEQAPILMPSCWINLAGKVAGKQTVPEQVQFASRLVVDCYIRNGELPKMYLISPFKEIKGALMRELRNREIWRRHGSTKPNGLSDWLKIHVGTVHTFQGKEEDTVMMVLGVDQAHIGAARWAASKPNILNVAITRSKRRFYIVGDKELWGELSYFKEATAKLPIVTEAEFSGDGL